jgi:NADH:ubiquinone oxidoreductase subunit K
MSDTWLVCMGLAGLLFFIGFYCLLTMRNIIKLLIGVEIIAKGITLALIVTGFEKGNRQLAQALTVTFIVVEVSVVATALAIIMNIHRYNKNLDIRTLNKLRG